MVPYHSNGKVRHERTQPTPYRITKFTLDLWILPWIDFLLLLRQEELDPQPMQVPSHPRAPAQHVQIALPSQGCSEIQEFFWVCFRQIKQGICNKLGFLTFFSHHSLYIKYRICKEQIQMKSHRVPRKEKGKR